MFNERLHKFPLSKPVYRPGGISTKRYNFFNSFMGENKSYNSFWLTIYTRAPFLQKPGYGKDELIKKCSYEGVNLICNNLPDACSVEFTNDR